MKQKKQQFGVYISNELFLEIKELSGKLGRSFNSTVDILLQQAVKERKRKRKPKQLASL